MSKQSSVAFEMPLQRNWCSRAMSSCERGDSSVRTGHLVERAVAAHRPLRSVLGLEPLPTLHALPRTDAFVGTSRSLATHITVLHGSDTLQ
jgi:hypothetical protein